MNVIENYQFQVVKHGVMVMCTAPNKKSYFSKYLR